MKRILFIAAATLVAVTAFAQGGNTGTGGEDGAYASLHEKVLGLEKKTEGFNLFVNYAASFREELNPLSSIFRAKHLSVEVKGSFGEHLTYRLRHCLNRSADGRSADNHAAATDIMMVGWRFNDKFAVQGGKICQYFGGFEYDETPMYIYQYSNLLEHTDCFLAGAAFLYTPVPTQEFIVSVTNSYSGRFADEYGAGAVTADGDPLAESRHPLCYIFNWNGSFLGGLVRTRWSVSSYTQAQRVTASAGDYHDNLVYLGQSLNLPKFQIYFDYMGNFEQLDRLRIASGLLCSAGTYLTDVSYNSLVTKFNWQFADRFNLMGKFMYETAATPDLSVFRTVTTGLASLEYYPLRDQDLRFFLACVGRNFNYTQGSGLSARNGTACRLELGLMYRIKCY